jgi:type IV pilus assembly protein PilB
MRILDNSQAATTIGDLQLQERNLAVYEASYKKPHGMILVTGPTGSGKSTTLFSVLSRLNTPNVNISTVEDPVEYRIPGVNQTQVNPVAGMTFTNGLRALLRQDPNIIMVGEIRDGETAGLGVQAALTGHLVFSTLHTNNAATCLPRLLEMGIEPFLIASTVRVVVGQRLVRRLCSNCRESYQPDAVQLKQLSHSFKLDGNSSMGHIHELEMKALADGIGSSKTIANIAKTKTATSSDELSTTATAVHRLWKAHDDGCDMCNHSGYKGRIGIYEVLHNSDAVQQLIVANGTSDNIQATAIKEGMITMQLDGFIKALRGETTIEEILRVTSQG